MAVTVLPGSDSANFELRLYEGQTRFDVIYGTVTNGNTSATAGVQKNDTAFDQYFCNGSGEPATGGQSYILQSCATSADANGNGLAKCYTYCLCYSDTYPDSPGYGYTAYRDACRLQHLYHGYWDWHDHAWHHRYWQPLR